MKNEDSPLWKKSQLIGDYVIFFLTYRLFDLLIQLLNTAMVKTYSVTYKNNCKLIEVVKNLKEGVKVLMDPLQCFNS